MSNIKPTWKILAAATVAAAYLAGCHDDTVTVPPRPAPQAADFSLFVNQVFMTSANATPASLNTVNFTFDVNDDPNAFNGLIMSGVF